MAANPTQRIGPDTRLHVVDALLSGTHEPGTSHYELLRAFADDATLSRMDAALAERDYRTHEFGDSLLIERSWGATNGEQVMLGQRIEQLAAM